MGHLPSCSRRASPKEERRPGQRVAGSSLPAWEGRSRPGEHGQSVGKGTEDLTSLCPISPFHMDPCVVLPGRAADEACCEIGSSDDVPSPEPRKRILFLQQTHINYRVLEMKRKPQTRSSKRSQPDGEAKPGRTKVQCNETGGAMHRVFWKTSQERLPEKGDI